MREQLAYLVKRCSSVHVPCGLPDVFLFSTPRGGSTWFMEMVASQPGFKYCDEPCNVRKADVARALGISTFAGLYASENRQRVFDYLRALAANEICIRNPYPFKPFYRPVTRRIVFKMIHGGTDCVGDLEDAFGARILYVIRHPIPVSLSREVFPLLEEFRHSDVRYRFDETQRRFADRVIGSGGHLEKGLVAWCLFHAPALKQRRPSWLVASYEEAVLNPGALVDRMSERLALPDRARMIRQSSRTSSTAVKSTAERRALLADAAKRGQLITGWTRKVSPAQEKALMEILDVFGIDAYRAGRDLPTEGYLADAAALRAQEGDTRC